MNKLSFSPTSESNESYPPQMFLNWSIGAQSSSLSSIGYFPAILTCNSQLVIQTINDEFLYLLDYQDELELIGKSAYELMGRSDSSSPLFDLESTGCERFGSLQRKDGSLVFGFLKLRDRPKDVILINFHQVPVESCHFNISSADDQLLTDLDNPNFFTSDTSQNGREAVSSDIPLLLDVQLPRFDTSNEKAQYLTLRKSEGCWPVKVTRIESKNNFIIQTFPSIGGLLIASREDFLIKSINNDLSQMITGFSELELVESPIIMLLPNFNDCIKTMDWFPLKTDTSFSAAASASPSGYNSTPKPFSLDLHHRDGGVIKVQIQCREINAQKDRLLAVWISYQSPKFLVNNAQEQLETPNIFSPSLVLDRKKSYHESLDSLSQACPASAIFPEIIMKSSSNLSIQDFDEVKALGEGSFSFIKLCVHKQDPKKVPVVIKYVVRSRILTWTRDYQDLGSRVPVELTVLNDLRKNPHQNILMMRAHFSDEFYYCFVFDFYPAFDLFELLERKKELSFDEIKSILNQTCSAVAHLHSIGIVHRDIKDENILIDSKGHVTLIDFGSAHYIEKGPFLTFYGTKLFCAPEILNGQPYEGRKQDVWQLGCLLFILIFKQNPFYSVEEILNGNVTFPIPLEDSRLVNLFHLILNLNETERCTVEEIRNHDWMQVV